MFTATLFSTEGSFSISSSDPGKGHLQGAGYLSCHSLLVKTNP